MNFRYDINGLRAIAVLSVLIFHFNSLLLPGGFAGVDVFFVISGFLMTRIIFQGLGDNSFSLVKFYLARARRIVPPLSVMSFVVLIVGYFTLIQPDGFEKLAKHVFSSAFFISNITYYLESGYFDVESKSKLLLHTWSLSVEWQFYILYPILLIVANALLPFDMVKKLIALVTLIGFLFSVFAASNWPSISYYSLPTRAWEMMMGGVAFVYPWHTSERWNKIIEILGLMLIMASCFIFSSETPWPGYFASLPVLGTYLIIVSNHQSSIITNNFVFQHVGKWSYSIYLWHWPLVSFAYWYNLKINYVMTIGMTLISVFIGWLSFEFVENKRFKYWYIMFISIVLASLVVINFNIKPFKFPYVESVIESMTREKYTSFNRGEIISQDVVVTKLTDGARKVVAVGDSHMRSSISSLEKIAISNDIELSYAGFNGCPPLINVYPIRNDQNIRNCNKLNAKTLEYITNNNIEIVYMAARWSYYTEGSYTGKSIQYLSTISCRENKDKAMSIEAFKTGLTDTLKAYRDAGVKVVILLQVPMQPRDAINIYFSALTINGLSDELLNDLSISENRHNKFQTLTNDIIKHVSSKFDNVVLLDPTATFCQSGRCLVGDDKRSFYIDEDHLSTQGANKLHNLLLPEFVKNQ